MTPEEIQASADIHGHLHCAELLLRHNDRESIKYAQYSIEQAERHLEILRRSQDSD